MRRNAVLGGLSTALILLAILIVATAFRTFNIRDWDGLQGLHPDERFIGYAVYNLGVPRSIGEYFNTAISPLNPRNFDWSRLFVYGTLPTTVARLTAAVFDVTRSEEYFVVGRYLSAFFDLVSCLALFFLGRRIYGRTAGLFAAALYAVTVMPIQQSHFFTTDNFAAAFTTLALVAATRLALDGRWRDALWSGVWIGAAVASKINLAALGAVVGIAVLQFWLVGPDPRGVSRQTRQRLPRWLKSGLLLAVAGLMTLLSFRIFNPDAFAGPQFWNILPDARFLEGIRQVAGLVNGSIDYPPSHQWAARTPYLFPWQNMVIWGMGLPLGLAAWVAFVIAGLRLLRARGYPRWRSLVIWSWVAMYFAWQGGGFNPSLRYFLPIYPPLVLFAAWGALGVGQWLQRRAPTWPRSLFHYLLPVTLLLLATTSWAWAFTRIYARPHTRIAAGNWMLGNAPRGSSLTGEQWDDALPFTNGNGNNCNPFCLIETLPYAEDELTKFVGRGIPSTGLGPGESVDNGLIGRLAEADYVVLSSARVYSSVVRLPHRFPATLRYYKALFDGSLGYELVADFHSFPTLFGMEIPDLTAEEQFTVYDHPRVLIFRRTDQFSPQRAREIITGGIVWDEIYRISARTTSDAPTALRLTDSAWQRLQNANVRYLFQRMQSPILERLIPLLGWVLAVELLGVAALGIVWRWRLPLPDHGVLSARLIGLVLFGVPPALLAGSGLLGVSRTMLGVWYGLLFGFGMRLLWIERARLRAFLRVHRQQIWVGQACYFVVALAVLLLRVLDHPAPGVGGFGYAPWAALLRSPVLPPPDPFFAGGQLMVPYAALLPLGLLARMVGATPSISFNLALATAGGLLVSLVVAATMRPLTLRSTARRAWSAWDSVPLLAAGLLLAPGVLVQPIASLTPLGMLASGKLSVLAALGLSAGVLVLSRAYAATLMSDDRESRRQRGWWLLPVLLGMSLALLRAHDRWVAIAVLIPACLLLVPGVTRAIAARYLPGVLSVFAVMAVLLVGGALLGNAPGSLSTLAPTIIRARFFTLATLPLLLLIMGYTLLIGGRARMRGVMAVVGLGLIVWLLQTMLRDLQLMVLVFPFAVVVGAVLVLVLGRAGKLGEQRLHRLSTIMLTALTAFALFTVAGRMAAGQTPGDPYLFFGLALLLMVCGTGWALAPFALLVRRSRIRSLTLASVVGLLLVLALSDTLISAYDGDQSAQASSALRGAADALAAQVTGFPVIATAPQSNVSELISRTGLSSLLAAPDAETSLRTLLRPSVDLIVNGRVRALTEIYGQDPSRAASQLGTYRVEYILVGPDERAVFGADAGIGLRQLAQRGSLSTVYSRDDVVLYRYALAVGTPPFVAQKYDLGLPSLKTAMLARPLVSLPAVNEYGWNSWANQNQPLALVLWLLLIEALGLLAWPLSRRIFGGSQDLGWAWSKLIGLLVWSYAIWLPVSLSWWSYTWRSLLAGLALLALLSWLAAGRPRTLRRGRGLQMRDLLRFEAIFLVAFGLWTLVRAANPDLWHPWLGGEKPFEFGMLNAIVRSPVMPPPDPFFSGGVINDYYYGLFLVSVPIRATGIDPAIAFNLIIPLLFALLVVGAIAVVRALTGRWRWGLLGAVFLTLLGPVASAFVVGESRGMLIALRVLREGVGGWSGRIGDWFWGPSRIIPNTINEFPLFSYLFADLHPHMIALPITVLMVALAVHLGRGVYSRRELAAQWPALLMAGMVIGTLAVANSWDAPTAALVLGGALAGRAWRSGARSLSLRVRLSRVAMMAGLAISLLAVGLLLYLPFFVHFRAMVGGIGRVRKADELLDFAVIYGTSLYVVLSLLAGLLWLVLQRAVRPLRSVNRRRGVVMAPLIGLTFGLGAWLFVERASAAQSQALPVAGSALPLLLIGLVGVGVVLAFVARLRDEEWLTLWIITAGLMVALGIQIIFVRDHLAGGDAERMNTVFKFGLQIWTLLALGSAAAIPLVMRMLRRIGEGVVTAWSIPLLVMILASLSYPLIGIPSRLGLRFTPHPGLTLDGLAFMNTARYENEGQQLDLIWDADAIRWLKSNLRGMPVVLQSEGEFYRNYGVRIAANTGFPTVLGRLHQDEQRPAGPVIERETDVKTIFSTPDTTVATNLLAKYQVDYVYVGQHERLFYGTQGVAKWNVMVGSVLDLAFENPGVRIYKVRPGLQRQLQDTPATLPPDFGVTEPATEPESVAPGDDSELAALEAANRIRPEDGSTAFGLASRYVQAGRMQDAAAVLSAAAPANPDDVPLLQMLGDIQAGLGRADEAIRAWQAAVDFDPSSGNISKLGTGLMGLGRYDEAEQVLRRAQERNPEDVLVHYYLGEVASKRNGPGDKELARQEYTTYLDQAPADSPFRPAAEQALRQLGN